MLRLIRWLITGDGHRHEWKIIKEFDIVDSGGILGVGQKYVLQCRHCGNVKKKVV